MQPAALTPAQALAALGYKDRKSLRRLRERGFLPRAWRLPSGHWRYDAEDIEALQQADDIIDLARRQGIV